MSDSSTRKNNPYAPPGELYNRRGTRDFAARMSSPTLIEILVVVAIIGILLALLLPVVNGRGPRYKNIAPPPTKAVGSSESAPPAKK